MTAEILYMPRLGDSLFKRRLDAQLCDADEEYAAGQFDVADMLIERARREFQERKAS